MITLTSVGLPDLSSVQTWTDFAAYLKGAQQQSGLSLGELAKIGKRLAAADGRLRDLPTSTVSDALRGRRPVKKNLLESLLTAWQVPEPERAEAVDTWQRLHATVGQGPPNARRVDEASLHDLGVRRAISIDGAQDEMPTYVLRDFDERLRDLIADGAERGCFVVLLGNSAWGKTRSLCEAVRIVVPHWWLVQPTTTEEIHDLLAAPTERTVLWLDDLQRFFGADPPLLKENVLELKRSTGMIVVGTLWPNTYFKFKRFSPYEDDVHAEARLIDFAEVIHVPDVFSEKERQRATDIAKFDSKIKTALSMSDVGVTQALAAAPDLVRSWEQAPDPYSKAMMSAAADARRLGVQSPLPATVLIDAVLDYLTHAQRARPVSEWLERGLQHATNQLHGAVSPLTPVARERAGSPDGFVIADYLLQHIGKVRRATCPPASLWTALANHVTDQDDLRRLANAALSRMRYPYAEQALRRLQQAGDWTAVGQLLPLLRRQGRLAEAIAMVDTWLAADSQNQHQQRTLRAELIQVQRAAKELRQRAADDPRAAELLAELLADGGEAAELRQRARAGEAVAIEDFAELLSARGCLDELRHLAAGGNSFVAERLAALLASIGREEELHQRAEAGDRIAGIYLERLHERIADAGPHLGELGRLRAEADGGDLKAATELVTLLFDVGDRKALLAEMNEGTHLAAECHLALLNADPETQRDELRRIRLFGLRADGSPVRRGGKE